MKRHTLILLLLGLCVPGEVFAQAVLSASAGVTPAAEGAMPLSSLVPAGTQPVPALGAHVVLPMMSPELALSTYQRRAAQQAAELAAYSAVTVIRAELQVLLQGSQQLAGARGARLPSEAVQEAAGTFQRPDLPRRAYRSAGPRGRQRGEVAFVFCEAHRIPARVRGRAVVHIAHPPTL